MNRMIILLCMLWSCLVLPLHSSSVVVTNSIEDITKKIEKYLIGNKPDEILVVFDVNMTLIRPQNPAATKASIKRFRPLFTSTYRKLSPNEQITLINLPTKTGQQELVSPELPKFIGHYQAKGVKFIALTSSLTGALGDIKNIEAYYFQLLKKLGVDFSTSFPSMQESMQFKNFSAYRDTYPSFYKGILFANISHEGPTKGQVLVEFLKTLPTQPKVIILVDDQREGSMDTAANVSHNFPNAKVKTFQYNQAILSSERTATAEEFSSYWKNIAAISRQKHEGSNARSTSTVEKPIQINPGVRTPTLNKMGWVHPFIDEITAQFLKDIKTETKPYLEIGAAFGYASKIAIENGATAWVNDLDANQLQVLEQSLSPKEKERTNFIVGDFPDGLELPSNFFHAVVMVRMLHFFSPDKLKRALKKAHEILLPDGKIYIVAETPFLRSWSDQIPTYQTRKEMGDQFPGYYEDIYKHHPEMREFLQDKIHFIDIETLKREVESAGFKILTITYMARSDYPTRLRLDGRETIGCIAQKVVVIPDQTPTQAPEAPPAQQ